MKLPTALILGAGACALALAAGLQAGRAAAATDAVRSVDVARVLQEHEPMRKEYEALRDKYQPQGDRLRKESDAIKAEKGQIAQLDRGSEEFAVRSFNVQLREKTLEEELEFWTAAQRRESEDLLARSVRRIHAACDELGRRSGVSAIVMRPGALPDAADARSSLRELESRWVVWSNPDHDVSDAVLAILREQG